MRVVVWGRRGHRAKPPSADYGSPAPSLSTSEWAAVMDLLHDQITHGWVPRRADIEAALVVVRSRSALASLLRAGN